MPSSIIALGLALLSAAPPVPAPAGPRAPVVAKTSPAQQAIALYHETFAHPGAATNCLPTRGSGIVVCGNGRSPNRLPLPEERGPPNHARHPIGEVPHADAGEGPVPTLRSGTTVAGFGMSARTRTRNATLKLIHEEEHARQVQAEVTRSAPVIGSPQQRP